MKRLMLAAWIFTLPTTASAQFYSGNEIHALCQSNIAFVVAYAAGAVDKSYADLPHLMTLFLRFYDKARHDEHTEKLVGAVRGVQGFCIPQGVKLGQVADVYCKFLRENPSERHNSAASLLDEALKTAWPCPK